MSSPLLSFACLGLLCWMAAVRATEVVSTCCLQTSNTTVRPRRIENYTLQSDAVCPIAAIMFHTIKGTRICSNPNHPWAKKTKGILDEIRAGKTRELAEGKTSTRGPAVTRGLTTRPKKGGRKRARQGRGNRKAGNRKGGNRRRKGQRSSVGTTIGVLRTACDRTAESTVTPNPRTIPGPRNLT